MNKDLKEILTTSIEPTKEVVQAMDLLDQSPTGVVLSVSDIRYKKGKETRDYLEIHAIKKGKNIYWYEIADEEEMQLIESSGYVKVIDYLHYDKKKKMVLTRTELKAIIKDSMAYYLDIEEDEGEEDKKPLFEKMKETASAGFKSNKKGVPLWWRIRDSIEEGFRRKKS